MTPIIKPTNIAGIKAFHYVETDEAPVVALDPAHNESDQAIISIVHDLGDIEARVAQQLSEPTYQVIIRAIRRRFLFWRLRPRYVAEVSVYDEEKFLQAWAGDDVYAAGGCFKTAADASLYGALRIAEATNCNGDLEYLKRRAEVVE